jgi:hypothetical protein
VHQCLKLCSSCSRCRYLSVALHACSWHHTCDLGGLLTIPDHFRTAPVADVHAAVDPPQPQYSPCDRTIGGSCPPQQQRSRHRHRHRFAFLVLAYRAPCAVRALLHTIRRWYQAERVFVHSDNMKRGGQDFSALCAAYNCSWRGFDETAGNPDAARTGQGLRGAMVFMRRVLFAIARCESEFLITLEDDVCIQRPPLYPPPACGDVGGLPGPVFDRRFVAYVERRTGRRVYEPAVWGCAGACYYRTDAWLAVAPSLDEQLVRDAASNHSWAVGYMDATAPTLALAVGLRVWPWSAVSTRVVMSGGPTAVKAAAYINEHVAAFTTRLLPQDRVFEHKCSEALALREATACAA